MSDAVQSGMLVFLTSGAFVGLAFQPPFWYFVAMGVCLRAHVWHAERAGTPVVKGWRLAAQRAREAALNAGPSASPMNAGSLNAGSLNSGPGWRKPPPVTAAEEPAPAGVWRGSSRARRGNS
jgi:hypothetical protein